MGQIIVDKDLDGIEGLCLITDKASSVIIEFYMQYVITLQLIQINQDWFGARY